MFTLGKAIASLLGGRCKPDYDCTDAACPCWWRGHEHTAAAFCQEINHILDGKDDGRSVAGEPWESTRRRLLALVEEAKHGR